MFRDFELDEVISSRFYTDVFPNELTELYDLNNYLIKGDNQFLSFLPFDFLKGLSW